MGVNTQRTLSALPIFCPFSHPSLPPPGRQSYGRTPSTPPALLRPLPRLLPAVSLAVFGSSGRPALYPRSLRHNRQRGAGEGRWVAGRAGPGLGRVAGRPGPLGIRLGFSRPAVAIETEQQREAGCAAGWGWDPPGGGGALASGSGVAGGSTVGASVRVSRGRPSGPRPRWPGLPQAAGAAHSPLRPAPRPRRCHGNRQGSGRPQQKPLRARG